MNSSVTISNELRKKIKKLAAQLDSTQGEIVEQAISIFEKTQQNKVSIHDEKARNIMKQATENNSKLAWRKKIRESLSSSGIDLEEFNIQIRDD
jgi:hypothetical protein